jgi:outer membrane protein assembly factor BamB
MSSSTFLRPLVALALLAAPFQADRLLTAGADGIVMQADTDVGTFAPLTSVAAGPIRTLAFDDQRLYVADELGDLYVYDVDDGTLLDVFAPGLGPIPAMATARGSLFVGTQDGRVVRLDPATGANTGERVLPAGVRAMVVFGGKIVVATADGAFYRASFEVGQFSYFTCFCFFNVQDMVIADGGLVVVDESGLVGLVRYVDGQILSAFSAGSTNSMAALEGELLFYYATGLGGLITRFDARTGRQLPGTFTTPSSFEVMLVIPDRARVRSQPDAPTPL